MRYIDEYRDQHLSNALAERICRLKEKIPGPVTFMEVCGTHTVAISRYGIRDLLPEGLRIISGPGCPVCVTPLGELDAAIGLASEKDVILATYGDMVRVPGSLMSLQEMRAFGADIRVVYSVLEALDIAVKNPCKQVIFLAVGFETTAPASALIVHRAYKNSVKNFSLLCLHKVIPPALKALLSDDENSIDGFICPGHVSVIIGAHPYEVIAEAGKAAVVTGFEPLDILEGLWLLLRQVYLQRPRVEIQYKRAVTWSGNQMAQRQTEIVFEPCTSSWRGLGEIPESGLAIKEEFSIYDAVKRFDVTIAQKKDPAGCCCGQVLRGVRMPYECPLFGKACTATNPVGPCMVSGEGACAAFYRFSGYVRPQYIVEG